MTKPSFPAKSTETKETQQNCRVETQPNRRVTRRALWILIAVLLVGCLLIAVLGITYISFGGHFKSHHDHDHDHPEPHSDHIRGSGWHSFYTETIYFREIYQPPIMQNVSNTFQNLINHFLQKFSNFSSSQNYFIEQAESSPQCNVLSDNYKFDCWPELYNATEDKCMARGCCWNLHTKTGVPYCYFPKDYPGYRVDHTSQEKYGFSASLSRSTKSPWPDDIMQLKMDVKYETSSRLHVKIYDPNNARYEVPIVTPNAEHAASDLHYTVTLLNNSQLTVQRKGADEQILFTTGEMAPMIFADQVLQLSTALSSNYLYGLGEHRGPFLQSVNWKKLAFWSRDQPPQLNANLYGDHPVYMNIEPDGKAHGLFFLNSNAMEVDLQPTPAITFRTTGGIMDYYIFTGPTPDLVVNQYLDVVGRTFMPPYWALGFHLCRWGYGGSAGLKKVIDRMREANMPYDTQWNDIDYMDNHLDWTYDSKAYSDLPLIVKDLHDQGQHYIPIVDPGISNTQKPGSYPPYDQGLVEHVFVMNDNGSAPIIGKVWPGDTVFPDFFHPNASDYWYGVAESYHNKIPFDGLWTDMNEPSDFVSGSLSGCPDNKLNNPPLLPPSLLGNKLQDKTLCPSAKQFLGPHYNLHSLYGHSEVNITAGVLRRLRQKRSIVISRSTFPSSGTLGGHWLGDNNAKWEDLYYSIPGILNFNMFGIPLVGADICGFNGDTTPELCTRWMQLGAFYPFMRNHNTKGNKDQDPASFDEATQHAMRKALELRYSLIPHLYSLFFQVKRMNQSSIVKPLFYRYGNGTHSQENVTYTIDKQFMWGDELMIVPVLTEGATTVDAYIPEDVWYDGYGYRQLQTVGQYVTLKAPIDKINFFIRGGSVIMRQPLFANTTTAARQQNFWLDVACDKNANAIGDFFWDDGETLDTIEKELYTHLKINLTYFKVESTVMKAGYQPPNGMTLGTLLVIGIHELPIQVQVDGIPWQTYSYNNTNESLLVFDMKIDMLKNFTVSWW